MIMGPARRASTRPPIPPSLPRPTWQEDALAEDDADDAPPSQTSTVNNTQAGGDGRGGLV